KLPNGQFTRVDTLVEGQTFSFSGFAFPLQYLNGGQLKFPDGSLNERITLTIEIPDWAKIVGNTIGFGDSVASAARLLVTRRDTLISPYAFEKPVELTLPIRSSLPPAVGSQVSKFVLTFRKTDGKFDTTGIRTAIRDSVLKIVKAEVSHFSDVAMTSSDLLDAPTSVETDRAVIPSNFVLYQNYPNPFNPSTVIRYGIPSRAHVNLVVYTLIGQQVATLVDQIQEPGMHTVAFNAGPLPSGVYVVTLRADSFRESRRIILLR
ncbi:MAG: T9SS type A sorting domain-containing protein, partial [Ignavibacteria bacterium]|nr:T9SS type A sorting domain-containing protein [Ignavibacteria bacterium]